MAKNIVYFILELSESNLRSIDKSAKRQRNVELKLMECILPVTSHADILTGSFGRMIAWRTHKNVCVRGYSSCCSDRLWQKKREFVTNGWMRRPFLQSDQAAMAVTEGEEIELETVEDAECQTIEWFLWQWRWSSLLHWAAVYGSTNGFFRARLLICYTANTVAQHISRVHYCTYETLTKCTLQDLAYRFVVSLSTVSRIFSYWIVAMQLSKCSQEDRSFVVNVSSSPQQQSCLRFLFLELTQRNQKSSGFTPPNFWRP